MINTGSASFQQYGVSFEEKVMQALLTDRSWAEQTLEVFDVSYFDVKYIAFLADRYFAHAKKYKVFPTLQLLVTIVRDELKSSADTVLRSQVVDYLTRIKSNPDPGDLPYVKEKSLDFCRKQALKRALEEAVDQIQAEKYEQIVEGIKKAVCVGTTPALGHDFIEDREQRFTRAQRCCVATGLPELDKKEIFDGGIGSGEIACVIAATGVGKSHFLTFLGVNALKAGVDVVHYTLELSEEAIGRRYDSNLCDINSNDVIDKKEDVIKKYDDMRLGRLIIKYFPTGTASIYTIRSHLERLDLKGIRPGLIIIDYADIMRSTRQYDSLRHELKLIYEELRGLAGERKVPIWTASQSNKEGSNAEIIDLGNMSEAYGKAMVADVVVSISRRAYEKYDGTARLYIAKNRIGKDGIVLPIKIDTGRSKFEVTGLGTAPEQVNREDERGMKMALKAKWDEMQRTGVIKDKPVFAPSTPAISIHSDNTDAIIINDHMTLGQQTGS